MPISLNALGKAFAQSQAARYAADPGWEANEERRAEAKRLVNEHLNRLSWADSTGIASEDADLL
jgi:hypothetical protein